MQPQPVSAADYNPPILTSTIRLCIDLSTSDGGLHLAVLVLNVMNENLETFLGEREGVQELRQPDHVQRR